MDLLNDLNEKNKSDFDFIQEKAEQYGRGKLDKSALQKIMSGLPKILKAVKITGFILTTARNLFVWFLMYKYFFG